MNRVLVVSKRQLQTFLVLWEFSCGQQLLSLGRDQSLSLAWICPALSQIQLFGSLFFGWKLTIKISSRIHFKDETSVPWSNRSRSVNHQPVCSYSDIFRKFSAPLALAFVLLQDLHVPKTSVRHGNLLPKSSKQHYKNSTSLRTLQRIGKILIASNLLIEAYSNQWNIMKQNGMIYDISKIHERCQPECSFLSKSWTTVSSLWCFCNTSRFLMILSFGISPLCLHKQDQAFGIKRPLRQCPGRIWSHNLPVQVPASCKHCK